MTLKERALVGAISQFGNPHGMGGRVAGWIMGHRSSNRARNAWLVSLLDIEPTDRTLEVGFGPGVAIGEVAKRAIEGSIHGVDRSDVMRRQATRRNRRAIDAGRVALRLGSAEDLPEFDQPFDVILAVNSHMFWDDLPTRLQHLRSLLRPGGRFGIGYQPRHPGATAADSANAAIELRALFEGAGFAPVRVETLDLDPPVVGVVGVR